MSEDNVLQASGNQASDEQEEQLLLFSEEEGRKNYEQHLADLVQESKSNRTVRRHLWHVKNLVKSL